MAIEERDVQRDVAASLERIADALERIADYGIPVRVTRTEDQEFTEFP